MDELREMFVEYYREMDFCPCFQGFDEELKTLPGKYFALIVEPGLGCVGVRPVDATTAEMKRLYVRPQARGSGLGRKLAEKAIAAAREKGYKRIVLDTMAGKMDRAIALYRSLGFREIPPYLPEPTPGATCMELVL